MVLSGTVAIHRKNEWLTTPQHKNKSAIRCQTNGIDIKRKTCNGYKQNQFIRL